MSDATLEEQRQQYEEIMKLYDYADDLALTVDSQFVEDPADQLQLVEPIIEQLEESTDVLTEEYIKFAEGKSRRTSRGKIEKALRKIYSSLDEYRIKLHREIGEVKEGMNNIADAIIMKIKEKLQNVIVIFLNFTQLSLDRVMHQHELDEIKQKQQNIFFQLHQMSQQP